LKSQKSVGSRVSKRTPSIVPSKKAADEESVITASQAPVTSDSDVEDDDEWTAI